MKRFVPFFLAILLILFALTACSPKPGASPTPTPTPTATPSAAPETSSVEYSTNIPDVSGQANTAICSQRVLYEDANSIYFQSPWYSDTSGVNHNALYRISKADSSVKEIAQNVSCMALSGGIVYFASGAMGTYEVVCNTVSQYDPATDTVTPLFTHAENLYGLAVLGGQIYYTADITPDVEDALATGLYRCAPDGTGETPLAQDAYSFCISDSAIYYIPYGTGDGAPIYTCGLDGSSPAQIVADSALYHFELSGNTMIYMSVKLTLRDMVTGSESTLPDYDDFALLGQYILLQGEGLDARDPASGKTYRLAELGEYWMRGWTYLHTGEGSAYLSAETDDGSFELYRIDIANGEANLTLVGQAQP